MTHIMLDLETWGTKPGCDIRSIGAVVFDPYDAHSVGLVGTSEPTMFYTATRNPDCYPSQRLKYPLTRDPETVKWWNEQSDEAQSAFANPLDLWNACFQFAYWLWQRTEMPKERYENWQPSETVRIWANDPHFDCSILAAVYDVINLPVPWHYRAPRSMRTITEAAGMTRDDYCTHGDAHHALHDAIAQAMTVCEAYKRLGLTR